MIYILNILIYNMKLLILICLNMITVIISNQLNLNYLHKDILRS